MINAHKKLEDIHVNIKLKLSALWVALTLCYLYGDYFELYTPGKVQGLISGENLLDTPPETFSCLSNDDSPCHNGISIYTSKLKHK